MSSTFPICDTPATSLALKASKSFSLQLSCSIPFLTRADVAAAAKNESRAIKKTAKIYVIATYIHSGLGLYLFEQVDTNTLHHVGNILYSSVGAFVEMAKAKSTTRNKSNSSQTSGVGNHLAEVTTISTRSVDVQDLIRNRAYQFFEERGRELGRDFDDWLRAEAEVLQQFRGRTA